MSRAPGPDRRKASRRGRIELPSAAFMSSRLPSSIDRVGVSADHRGSWLSDHGGPVTCDNSGPSNSGPRSPWLSGQILLSIGSVTRVPSGQAHVTDRLAKHPSSNLQLEPPPPNAGLVVESVTWRLVVERCACIRFADVSRGGVCFWANLRQHIKGLVLWQVNS